MSLKEKNMKEPIRPYVENQPQTTPHPGGFVLCVA